MQDRSKTSAYHTINPELYAEENNLLVKTNSPPRVPTITCPDCKKGFVDNRTLQRHAVIHRGLRPFNCQDCGKAFMLRGDLTRHLLIHSGKRPYACNFCERRFTLKGNLMQHIRTHTPEKQFTCTLCRKNFSQRESLYRHIRAHFGEKPFCCDTCGKTFSLRGDLTRHILIHTGQRPHLCPICHRSFVLKGNMMQHMRTHRNCVEFMALRGANENRSNEVLNFAEHVAMSENSSDKQIWQVTETNNNRNDERLHSSVVEPQIDIHVRYPSKVPANENQVVNYACTSVTKNDLSTNSISSQSSECNLCVKTAVSLEPDSTTLTYMSPIRPFNGSQVNTVDNYSNQTWSQHSVACSLCGKPFKNRRYLKLHMERHKHAHTDFRCTRCHKSFLSKSEHFFHSCKGIPVPLNCDPGVRGEPGNIVPSHHHLHSANTNHNGKSNPALVN